MEFLFFIIVVGILVKIVFWGTITSLFFHSVKQQYETFENLYSSYENDLKNIEDIIQQAQIAQQKAVGHKLPSNIEANISGQLMQMQQKWNHMDALSQQRLELSNSSMLSQASSVGIDVSSWN